MFFTLVLGLLYLFEGVCAGATKLHIFYFGFGLLPPVNPCYTRLVDLVRGILSFNLLAPSPISEV